MKIHRSTSIFTNLTLCVACSVLVFARYGRAEEDPKEAARKAGKDAAKTSQDEKGKAKKSEVHITVEADADKKSYRATEATTATRTDTPIFDTPLNIQVVRKQVLDDQDATSLYDGVRNVSGVHKENVGGFSGTVDTFFLRGFRNNFLYYDGFMTESMNSVNPTMVERIEVLKGPSSMIYGLIEPGGVINIVPKKPKENAEYHFNQTIASYDYYRTDVDVTGPITKDKKLLFRFGANYTTNESFRDHVDEDRFQIAPMIEWRPTRDTRINFDLNYSEQHRVLDEGVSFTNRALPAGDIDTFLGESHFAGQNFSELFGHASISHQFNEHITVRSNFLAHHWLDDLRAVRRSQGTPNAQNRVNRLFDDTDFQFLTYQWDTEVLLKYDLGFTKHKVLFGVDLRDRDNDIDLRRRTFANTSVFTPVYGLNPGAYTTVQQMEMQRKYAGIYLQDEISLTPKQDELLLLLGGRFDYVRSEDFSSTANPRSRTQFDRAWSWRTGLMWHPVDMLGVFASACRSFDPTTTGQRTFDNQYLDAEIGMQYEAGLKFEFLDKRVLSTLAVYNLDKDNVAIGDPLHPGFNVNGGLQRTRGVEFDIAGEVFPGLQIIGNYTYTDSEVVKITETGASPRIHEGARLRNIPLHSGSLWAKYTIGDGRFKNLGFGAGLFARGDMMIDDNSIFKLAGYKRLDLAIYYAHALPLGQIRASLNVKNATDAEFYESSLAITRVFPGAPRTFSFNLGFDF